MAAPSSLRLVVHGAAGRMGRRVVAAAAADSRVQLVAALDRAGGPHSADDAGVLAEVNRLQPFSPYDTDDVLPRVHAVEFLGEPQYGGGRPVPPQPVWKELAPYAATRLPTSVTHSEERVWRFYAGLSDYPHYDAYRVTAPAPDAWSRYDRWSGESIRWGAPLETIGEMTRSLRSLVAFPDLIEPITRFGREVRMLDDYYLEGDAVSHERVVTNGNPTWDLDVIAGPRGALMFALDLTYRADRDERVFEFAAPRECK